MLEKDYIMRIIHQFARFLARVLLRINNEELKEARMDMQTASERFLGMQLDMILSLNNQGLIEMLSIGGELDVEKSYIAAQLFFCEAKVRDADNRTGAKGICLRSLDLLLKSFPRMDKVLKREATSAIEQILSMLKNEHLPVDMYEELILYYEHRGEYSKAEDCLFELIESGFEKALKIGESFYERLMKKTDRELERGNLPRSEVEEGLLDLRGKFDI